MRTIHGVFQMRSNDIERHRVSRPPSDNDVHYNRTSNAGPTRENTRSFRSRGRANRANRFDQRSINLTPHEFSGVLQTVSESVSNGIERGISLVLQAQHAMATNHTRTTDQTHGMFVNNYLINVSTPVIPTTLEPEAFIDEITSTETNPVCNPSIESLPVDNITIDDTMRDSDDEVINQAADEVERNQGKVQIF